MKKFIPLGTAVLALVGLISVFFRYMTQQVVAVGNKIGDPFYMNTMGDDKSLFANLDNKTEGMEFLRSSAIFYIIALVLLALVIAIAVLNFLGIGGKNVGYAFIGVSFLAFISSLIAMILLFKTKTISGVGFEFTPNLAPWWITISSFLAFLSTGNVLLDKKSRRKRK
jgi:uncharacterized Tic20 family protein